MNKEINVSPNIQSRVIASYWLHHRSIDDIAIMSGLPKSTVESIINTHQHWLDFKQRLEHEKY